MRIALTHNLRLTDSEEEAEFDSRETIDALSGAMERLGHRVERIEVSGPASRTAARLEAFAPDLIFNTAEGRRGRFREAFYPALFDELGFPYTGSDAWVLAVTLDKALTKLMLSEHGVISPRGQFIDDIGQLKLDGWRWPVIVKPNFEGSSKGITQESVIEDRTRLRPFVEKQLARFPAGCTAFSTGGGAGAAGAADGGLECKSNSSISARRARVLASGGASIQTRSPCASTCVRSPSR